jgi:uncharacterized protein DUF6602
VLRNRFLTKYFADLERVIAANYGLAPTHHRSDKGEDREEFLLSVLNNHLPQIARAHRGGIILDCDDSTSSQTDIVINSLWSPMLRQNKKPIFLAQGVYAAVEVKSVLSGANLLESLRASARIKRMKKFLLPNECGIIGFGQTPESICTGLFAYTSRLTKPERVREVLLNFQKTGVDNTEMIDFICVNGQYCFGRVRTEDIAGYYPASRQSKPKTLESVRKECRYLCSDQSFGTMFSMILDYVSYIGPVRQAFDLYLYDRS